MGVVGAGSVLMALVLATYVYALFRMLLFQNHLIGVDAVDLPVVTWSGSAAVGERAWIGPLSVFTMVLAMYGFTALSFEILQGMSVSGIGGH